jgi:hypothetical protein
MGHSGNRHLRCGAYLKAHGCLDCPQNRFLHSECVIVLGMDFCIRESGHPIPMSGNGFRFRKSHFLMGKKLCARAVLRWTSRRAGTLDAWPEDYEGSGDEFVGVDAPFQFRGSLPPDKQLMVFLLQWTHPFA